MGSEFVPIERQVRPVYWIHLISGPSENNMGGPYRVRKILLQLTSRPGHPISPYDRTRAV